ncbi:MAG: HAMP domain-containing histidine kinase [Bacteroidia bacterium]
MQFGKIKDKKKPAETSLEFWRRKLFNRVLYIFFIAALIVVGPSAWGSFKVGVPVIGFIDIIAFVLIAIFHLIPSLNPIIRERAIELIFFIGAVVILFLGPEGAGFVWLLCYSAFSTIIFGEKGSKRSYLLIVVALVLIGIEVEFVFFPELKVHGYSTMAYCLTASNALAVMLMINVAFSFIINRLQKLFFEERLIADKYKEKSKALETSNENLDNLVYSISHDIRSPLANIKGLASLGKEDSSSQVIKDYFQKIESSADRLQEFTKQITDFFKLEKQEPNFQKTNLGAFINDLFEHNFSHLFLDSDSFVNAITSEEEIETDQLRLTQIFINLFSNSIKYKSPERPLLIDVSVQKTSSHLIVCFQDNGMGISEDFLPMIWEMFSRGTKRSQGAGLGLYIVNQCAISINADIIVESEVDEYTRFSITFPI